LRERLLKADEGVNALIGVKLEVGGVEGVLGVVASPPVAGVVWLDMMLMLVEEISKSGSEGCSLKAVF
jgi:hypothetical protein